jgi:hypothetical protein
MSKSYDPEAVGDGQYVVAFVESAGEVSPVFERKVRDIFSKHLGDVSAEAWYPLPDLIAAFDEIEEEIGTKTMRQGGREAAAAIPWPDGVDSPEAAHQVLFEAHQDAYRESTRENPAGNYTVEIDGDRSATVGVLDGYPYPRSFAAGVFKYIFSEFGPEDAAPRLEETTPNPEQSAAWTVTW